MFQRNFFSGAAMRKIKPQKPAVKLITFFRFLLILMQNIRESILLRLDGCSRKLFNDQ
jgi:hypothetical protein